MRIHGCPQASCEIGVLGVLLDSSFTDDLISPHLHPGPRGNLRFYRIPDLHQLPFRHLTDEAKHVALAALRFQARVFLQQGIAELPQRPVVLEQGPELGAHRVQAVVDPIAQVQHHGFAVDLARHLLTDRLDNRGRRNAC